jgi:hypothetical protein
MNPEKLIDLLQYNRQNPLLFNSGLFFFLFLGFLGHFGFFGLCQAASSWKMLHSCTCLFLFLCLFCLQVVSVSCLLSFLSLSLANLQVNVDLFFLFEFGDFVALLD